MKIPPWSDTIIFQLLVILFAEFLLVLLHELTTDRSVVSEELHLVPGDAAEKCVVKEQHYSY